MTPAAVKAILRPYFPAVPAASPDLIGWEPMTRDLEPTEENLRYFAGVVIDCKSARSRPVPHRLVIDDAGLLSVWMVPDTEHAPEGAEEPPVTPPNPEPQPRA